MWESAKAIMASSGQKLNLTDIACRRDMSMLLAQSAVQAGLACFCKPPSSLHQLVLMHVLSSIC